MSWGGKYKLEKRQNSLEMAPEQGFRFLWEENSNLIFNGNAMETKEIVDLIKVWITYLALTRERFELLIWHSQGKGDHNLDTMQNMASRNGEWEVGLSSTGKPPSTEIGGILQMDKEKVYALSWF